MNVRSPHTTCACPFLAAALLVPAVASHAAADDKGVRFETEVLPILQVRCLKCHGEGKVQGGLDLRRRSAMLEGGDGGPSVVPGKPGDSLLVQRVEKGEMPPPKEGALDKRQQDVIRRWIAAGAPLARPEGPPDAVEKVARVTDEDRRFWAFQPPKRPAVPSVKASQRVRNPIDAFLLARLEAKGMSFSPEASRDALVPRVYLDLHGLPPTPEERAQFLADDRPDAFERLVDRLLASPASGERWGRHWLDVAGYADSDGYLAADRLRPEARRYRDYVIQSLNDDVPYDRFVTEQLAGDELSDWRRAAKLTPEMVRQLTATGFLRTASDPTYPGYTEPNEIHQVLGDTMQIVGTAFLGLTVHCARCHDHKLDPIPTRDYYALQTVFLPALDPKRWQPSEVRGIRLATEKEWAEVQEHNKKVDVRLLPLNAKLAELTKKAGAKKDAKPSPEVAAEVGKVKAEVARVQAEKKAVPLLRGLADLDGKFPEGRVLRRGDHGKPGAKVAAAVPEVLAPAGYRLKAEEGYKSSGRRLALARWLTDPAHPLTARVQVNRMWAQHFGRGLVATPANFGRSGAKPSHPALLDWLATEFVRTGWGMKAMHRLMVTSTAYRQASAANPSADPDNVLLSGWRPRRLEGEAVRDSVLAVSGKLSGQRFGPPATVVAKGDGSVDSADDAQGNRRSVYLIVRRSQHLTLLDLFDTPLMEVNCPERNVSTVPLQALALLHGPFTHRNGAALADRILKGGADDEARVRLAYRLAFSRDPRPAEITLIRDFVHAVRGEQKNAAAEREAWTQVALVLFNSNEFLYVP